VIVGNSRGWVSRRAPACAALTPAPVTTSDAAPSTSCCALGSGCPVASGTANRSVVPAIGAVVKVCSRMLEMADLNGANP
jgi:hypothetical protein